MQHPILNLCLIGFSEQESLGVAQFLAANMDEVPISVDSLPMGEEGSVHNHPVWQLTQFQEANAVLLNLDHASVVKGRLRLRMTSTDDQPSQVNLDEFRLPCALHFSQNQQGLDAVAARSARSTTELNDVTIGYMRIDVQDKDSLLKALQYFEAALRPLRTLFTLAQHITERRAELDDQHTFHLVRQNILDMILDIPQRCMMMRDGMRPVDLQDTAWLSRPASANSPPAGFRLWTLEEVAWVYAMHCREFHLPSRYKAKPIYFRRMPRVRPTLLYPRHVRLLEMLGSNAMTFTQLCDSRPGNALTMQRDLYGLFMCRIITTQATKANKPSKKSIANSDAPASSLTSNIGPDGKPYHIETMFNSLI